LPNATVNIIDPATGEIIATTVTDADGYYQVFVPEGGPYILQAIKGGVKVQQITSQVEIGIEYDLGTADCSTTSVALIAQAMLVAEDYPNNLVDINLTDIETDPDFNDVMNPVCSTIEAGGDPAELAVIQQAVEDFLYPPAPTPPAPIPNYTVTFDKNDNDAAGDMVAQTIASGSSANLKACGFTKTGWTFAGWAETSGGDVAYADKASYTMGTSNVTLYAKWTANNYTVTFNKNGGDTEADPTTKPAAHGGNVGTLPTEPTRTGYTFSSWNTETNGSGTEFTATTEVTADLTVYAQWTSSDATISAGTLATVSLAGTFTGGANIGASSALTVTIPDASCELNNQVC